MITKPQYIFINNAKRQKIIQENSQAVKREFPYRQGDLGLIHPSITGFYSNLEQNTKKGFLNESGKGYYQKQPTIIQIGGLEKVESPKYILDPKDIPVLLTTSKHENFNRFSHSPYSIGIFRKGEFQRLNGENWGEIAEQIFGLKASKDLNLSEENTQWRYLNCFQTLAEDKIHHIPLKLARFKISREKIPQIQKYLDNSFTLC